MMSLLKNNSPQATRNRLRSKNSRKESKIYTVSEELYQKNQKEQVDPEILIERYSYKPKEETREQETREQEVATKKQPEVVLQNSNVGLETREQETREQKVATKKQPEVVLQNSNVGLDNPFEAVTLYNLNYFCEERLCILARKGISKEGLELLKLQQEYLYRFCQIFSDEYKILTNQDLDLKIKVFVKEGVPLIPQELYPITGFLREYFNITQVYLAKENTQLILKPTLFCNYWFEDKLRQYLDKQYPVLTRSNCADIKVCDKCSLNCNFREEIW
jgi:hypothetical protein